MEFAEHDPGPPLAIARHFESVPDYSPFIQFFPWLNWGPVFYRGRLDSSARILCVASDPAQIERIANRALVGDAGQRVQGFLAKLGIERTYVCLNAFVYPFVPRFYDDVLKLTRDPKLVAWRNKLFELAVGEALEAIVAFGGQAAAALELWPGAKGRELVQVPHPSNPNERVLVEQWSRAVKRLRTIVTPDIADPLPPNYGNAFSEGDYKAIPRADLPFGCPLFLGNNAWARRRNPPETETAFRPPGDPDTIMWNAPLRAES